jgi:hypothetical protein
MSKRVTLSGRYFTPPDITYDLECEEVHFEADAWRTVYGARGDAQQEMTAPASVSLVGVNAMDWEKARHGDWTHVTWSDSSNDARTGAFVRRQFLAHCREKQRSPPCPAIAIQKRAEQVVVVECRP